MNASDLSLLFALAGMSVAGCQSDDTAGDTDPGLTDGPGPSSSTTTNPSGTPDPTSTSGAAETGTTAGSTTATTETATQSTADSTASEDSGEESSSGSSSSSTGTGGLSPLEICEGFYDAYGVCFPRYAGYGDCEYTLDHFEEGACVDSVVDYFGCLSGLECRTLETYDGFPCRDEFTLISESCDDGFGYCQVTEGTFDFNEPSQFCMMTQRNCLDDHVYDVDCAVDSNAGNIACTCQTDGEEIAFTLEGDAADCGGEPFYEALVIECGWPQEAADNLM